MKKRLSIIAIAAAMTVMASGCGIVKVVPIGEEASFTGEKTFDAAEESGDDWEAVVQEIKENAVDLAELLNGDGVKTATAVTTTAAIIEFNTEKPKHFLLLEVEGVETELPIQVQAGGVYSGTAIRDAQTLKNFESFTNQTEWSQYAKSLNTQVDEQVVVPLALDDSVAGKTVTLTGVIEKSTDKYVITPVSMNIE